jgi:hypothetical protein
VSGLYLFLWVKDLGYGKETHQSGQITAAD